jgi:hypothetical protein
MRKVMVKHLAQPSPIDGVAQKWQLVDKGEALFHQFGVDYQEFENGAGNYSTALVEWQDGTVESVRADRIRFMDAV